MLRPDPKALLNLKEKSNLFIREITEILGINGGIVLSKV